MVYRFMRCPIYQREPFPRDKDMRNVWDEIKRSPGATKMSRPSGTPLTLDANKHLRPPTNTARSITFCTRRMLYASESCELV